MKLIQIHVAIARHPGHLPFLVHGQHTVSTFALIIKYVAGLKKSESFPNANLDATMDQTNKSQSTAWCAHVEANLGDIVVSLLVLPRRLVTDFLVVL